MVLPHRSYPDANTMRFVRDEMLRSFAQDTYPPIEVSEADLVSVVMDARFQVRTITIHCAQIGRAEATRLEHALVSAINQAISDVTRRNAQRLTRALDQASSYSGPNDKPSVAETSP
jgi:DNA-binding protein YbaB